MWHRNLLIGIIAMLSAAIYFVGCGEPKPKEPPPECVVDNDCKPLWYCEAGKCLKMTTTPKMRAEVALNEADKLVKSNDFDYEVVVAKYERVLAEVPTTPYIDFNIGLAKMRLGKFAEAEEAFLKTKEENPDDPNVILALGELYRRQGAVGKERAIYEEYIKAHGDKKDFDADKHPNVLDIRANLADLHRRQKAYEKGMEQIRKIFVKDPAHKGAFLCLSIIYLEQGKKLLARMVTVNGIEAQKNTKRPPFAPFYNNLGYIYLTMGDKDRAIGNFRKAHEIDPRFAPTNLNLAHFALKYNDFKNAYDHYKLALAEDPDNWEGRVGFALAMAGLGRAKESVELFKELRSERPDDAKLIFNIGTVYYDYLRDGDKAKMAFTKFLELGYDDEEKIKIAKNNLTMIEAGALDQPQQYEQQQQEMQQQQMQEGEGGEEQPAAEGEEAAPAEEAPAEEAPAEEAPAEEAPAEEAPAEEAPAEEAPAEQAPAEEAPAEQAPAAEEAPAEESPAEEAPAEEAPAEEAPAEEAPVEEAPAEEAPAEEAPAEEAPAEEAPAEEAPAEEAAPAKEDATEAEAME